MIDDGNRWVTVCDLELWLCNKKSVVSAYSKRNIENSNGLMVMLYEYYLNIFALSPGFNSGCGHFFYYINK